MAGAPGGTGRQVYVYHMIFLFLWNDLVWQPA